MNENLFIPMYKLHYVQSIDDVVYDENSASLFRRDYTIKERKEIFESLKWAVENPNYNFKSIVTYEDLKFSNIEIYSYLKDLYDFMRETNLNEY